MTQLKAKENEPQRIVIGIASNYQQKKNVEDAIQALAVLFQDLKVSTPVQTKPLEKTGPEYLNALATATTTIPPRELISILKAMETISGRNHEPNSPVTLDLDLLAYGNLVAPELRLPRRELFTRDFNRIPAEKMGCLPDRQTPAFD